MWRKCIHEICSGGTKSFRKRLIKDRIKRCVNDKKRQNEKHDSVKNGRKKKREKKERKLLIKDRKKTEEMCREVFGPDNI